MSNAYNPPPAYAPPGQEPPRPMISKDVMASAPPPPGIYQPMQHQPQTNTSPPVVIYTTTTTAGAQFGPYPQRFTCPNCNAHVMTETQCTPGLLTYILSGVTCLLGGYLCCCLIPCCVKRCKDIEHKCPNCQHTLGIYTRI